MGNFFYEKNESIMDYHEKSCSIETLNHYNNKQKRNKTVKKEQQLKKQFSLYLDILTHQGPHVEIAYAAMKIAEILYPSMVNDLRSICLFEIVHGEDEGFNIFQLYLKDYETFLDTIKDCDLIQLESDIARSTNEIFTHIDFDFHRSEDHSTLVSSCYGDNPLASDLVTDIMLLLNPKDTYAYHLKGIIFSDNDFSKAETYLKRASTSTTNPNMAQISCRVLGDLYLNHDLPIKAARQYEQCLKYGSVSELVLDGLEKAKEMIRNVK